MFSLKQITLRKITIDNSVNHIRQSEQTEEGDSKPKTLKNISLSRKQYKNLSQNNKN